MSLNSLIIDTLSPIGVPVEFMVYTGTATTYITFQVYNENGTFFAGDEEEAIEYSVRVDVWSKGNFNPIVEQVKARLKVVGFQRHNAYDRYDGELKVFQKVLQFYYTTTTGGI